MKRNTRFCVTSLPEIDNPEVLPEEWQIVVNTRIFLHFFGNAGIGVYNTYTGSMDFLYMCPDSKKGYTGGNI